MSVRLTQQILWTAFTTDPKVRATTLKAEVLNQDNTVKVRATGVKAEIAVKRNDVTVRATTMKVEVLSSVATAGGGGGSGNAIIFVIAS